ncbi:MinD/ParA family protein [Denitratisoma sp. agr-D3]
MAELGSHDQAAGLRRLFGNRGARSVAFVHVRRGAESAKMIARAANGLADHGHGVVVVDEQPGGGGVLALAGQRPRYDLFDVFIGACRLEDVMIRATPSISLVPAARAAREFGVGEVDIEQRMRACLAELGVKAGFVLVDANLRQGDVSQLAKAADHMAIVAPSAGRDVTDAYTLIKRQGGRHGRREFQLVLENVGNSLVASGEARTIFQNLRTTTQKHLGARLGHLATLVNGSADDLVDGLLTRLSATNQPPREGGTTRLRGLFGASGLFESVV